MKKKGFTLVELLGVIVILGLMCVIVIPAVNKSVEKARDDAYNIQVKNIVTALENYRTDNYEDFLEDEEVILTLYDLKLANYIDYDLKNPKTNKCISNNTKLKFTRIGNKYKYEVLDDELEEGNEEECSIIYFDNDFTIQGDSYYNVDLALPYVEPGIRYSKEGFLLMVSDEIDYDLNDGKKLVYTNGNVKLYMEFEEDRITYEIQDGDLISKKIRHIVLSDSTPPSLTINSVEAGKVKLEINYTTSDSDSKIDKVICYYGNSASYGSSVLGSNGKCVIRNLLIGTNYYYKVESYNISTSTSVVDIATTTLCDAGYYGASGETNCTICPTGFTSAAFSTDLNKCYMMVEAGYSKTSNSGKELCLAGTYNSVVETKAYYNEEVLCSVCGNGNYTNTGSNAGATSCTACPIGSSCNGKEATSCSAGTYASTSGSSSCTKCEVGYYCTGGSNKTACPTGYTSAAGAAADTKCYIMLQPGEYKTATGTATKCSAGKYYASERKAYYNTAYQCSTCVKGRYTDKGDSTGATSCTLCPIGSSCNGKVATSCAAGTYSDTTGATSCTTCEAGYYCTGGSNKTACPDGKTSAAGATSESACYSVY